MPVHGARTCRWSRCAAFWWTDPAVDGAALGAVVQPLLRQLMLWEVGTTASIKLLGACCSKGKAPGCRLYGCQVRWRACDVGTWRRGCGGVDLRAEEEVRTAALMRF